MNIDYPELYYRVYPKILSTIDKYLDEDFFIEELTEEEIEEMVDNIYMELVKELPEIHEDSYEIRVSRMRRKPRTFYGRSRIIRDLISVFLISELLRRKSY